MENSSDFVRIYIRTSSKTHIGDNCGSITGISWLMWVLLTALYQLTLPEFLGGWTSKSTSEIRAMTKKLPKTLIRSLNRNISSFSVWLLIRENCPENVPQQSPRIFFPCRQNIQYLLHFWMVQKSTILYFTNHILSPHCYNK